MEFRDQVRKIADGLRGKERVTYKAVRGRLKAAGGKCSYTTLKPVLAEWKADTEYMARIEGDPDLPESVQKGLLALGHLILREGEEKARRKLSEQERKLARQAEFLLEGDDELALAADRMEEEIVGLREEIVRLHEALARAQGGAGAQAEPTSPSSRPLGLDPITAGIADLKEKKARSDDPDALLAEVGTAVHALLVERGPLTAGLLHFHLQGDLGRRAERMEMPLEAGWLRHWLRGFTGPAGGLVEGRTGFDLASRTADLGAAYRDRVLTEVAGLLDREGFPMALSVIAKRLSPRIGQELRLTGGQLAEWMDARSDRFRKTGKGRYSTHPDKG
ncbi:MULTISPECIES: DNA-binding protein [unclassified Methylobacterium]|uniref:DNA-binding protein n=1 Tax=unclassified Methylobacterium TaxID=2615210 RepID=UPI0011C209C9|nr:MULTISPECIES: DNA-binding protein [unclassified Methylobacterium]QEE41014.1 hypothetical protein FVA80_20585 [Methylobacterium sp. WL1]TXN58861.1 hypothetical protein FV241_04580 [Methylobacterium sp. WL2]